MSTDADEAKKQGNAALGRNPLKNEDIDEAIALYSKAIELGEADATNENVHVYYSNRSAAYMTNQRNVDKALADAKKCVSLKVCCCKCV
jgi:tetratricopeptide (TPR) repeat protein